MTTPLSTAIWPKVIRTRVGQLGTAVPPLLEAVAVAVALADPLAVADVLVEALLSTLEGDGDAAATARCEAAATSNPVASTAADRYREAGLVSII